MPRPLRAAGHVAELSKQTRSTGGPGRDTLFYREFPVESGSGPTRRPGGWGRRPPLRPQSAAHDEGDEPLGSTPGTPIAAALSGRDTLFHRAFPEEFASDRIRRAARQCRRSKLARWGDGSPAGTKKGSPPVMGIRFHIRGKRIPGNPTTSFGTGLGRDTQNHIRGTLPAPGEKYVKSSCPSVAGRRLTAYRCLGASCQQSATQT